jgi:glycosyltransferase involved in cell wall biosynthesis
MITAASSHHILHIITRLDLGGSAENTLLTALGLVEKGYRVTIICGSSDNPPSGTEKTAVTAGIRIIRMRHMVRNISLWHDTAAVLSLFAHMKTCRYSLVHTHTSKAGIIGRAAACLAGVRPVVHTPHGHIFYGYFSKFITAVFVHAERALMRCTDILITLTHKEKDDYLAKGIGSAGKIAVVYSGIDLGRFLTSGGLRKSTRAGLGLTETDVVIGTIARLVPIKNHEMIVEAARILHDCMPYLRFVFAGDGELRETLEASVQARGLADRFVFAGWRSDIAELVSAFDIFVMCSRNEGLGRAFLEAQAGGVPVVGTRVGGVAEVLDEGNTGLLVESGDARALAAAIGRLAADRDVRARMSAACRQWVTSRFSAGAMVDKIEGLYRGLLAEKTG